MSTETYNLWAIIINGVTLVALLYYTYYTRQILLTSQTANESTRNELVTMQGQLTTAQAAFEHQRQRALTSGRPVFVWTSKGDNSPTFQEIRFKNFGGPIAILETRAVGCDFRLEPANFLDRTAEGGFILRDSSWERVRYVGIKFMTEANEEKSVVFKIEKNSFSPRVDSGQSFDVMQKMPLPSQPVDLT